MNKRGVLKLTKKATIITLIVIGFAVAVTIYIVERTGPQTAKEYFKRGWEKAKAGQYKEAVKDYDEAIELDSKLVYLYNYRAYCKFLLRQYKAAAEDYDKVILSELKDAHAYNSRADCKYYLKQYKEAIKD